MPAADFEVSVGALTAKSADQECDWYLTALSTELGIGGIGHATIQVAASSAALPKLGDAVTIKLGGKKIFTGQVFDLEASPDTLVISAADGLAQLARLEVQAVYENKTAGAIAKDILQKAGLQPGTVHDGPTFARYVLHRGPRAMRHLEQLAERAGVLVFADPAGKIHFAVPKSGSADHTFAYATHVLQLALRAETPAFDSVIVWGEGAAGEKGAEKAHWLATKLSAVSGKAAVDAQGKVKASQAGEFPLSVRDGTVRAAADAAAQAQARLFALAARAVRGFIETLGEAAVEPGQLAQIDGIPKAHPLHALAADKILRVRRVHQTFSASRGFVTRMEL